jgi:hypothetical protein
VLIQMDNTMTIGQQLLQCLSNNLHLGQVRMALTLPSHPQSLHT